MRVLITGGAGFIGSNLAAALATKHDVVVFDNFSTGSRVNLTDVDVEIVEGDLREPKKLKMALRGCECVFHQAALPSVARSVKEPLLTHEVNSTGTLNALIAARDAGCKRFIYAASSSAYGDTPTLPKIESMPPRPLSPYALSKLSGEYHCAIFASLYGISTVSLRYFNVFGPKQDPNSEYAAVVPKFITSLLAGNAPVVYGDGEQSRDFTYIKNVVDANILAMSKGGRGEVLNIGAGDRTTVNQLVSFLNESLGTSITPVYLPPRSGDIKHSLADISLAKSVLGYTPRYGVKEGLRETVAWFRSVIR